MTYFNNITSIAFTIKYNKKDKSDYKRLRMTTSQTIIKMPQL